MLEQIAAATNEDPKFISDIKVEDGYADFRIDGVHYFAKLSRGKVIAKNVRRA